MSGSTKSNTLWVDDGTKVYPKNARDIQLDTAAGKNIYGTSFSQMQTRRMYGEVSRIVSSPNLFLSWLSPATTEADLTGTGNTATYATFTTADQYPKGMVWSMLGDAPTAKYLTIADSDSLSFGNGLADSAFSIFAWVNVINSTAERMILAKWDSTTGSEQREWSLGVDTSEKLVFAVYDESEDKTATLTSDSGLSVGWHFVCLTYDGTGGAGAMTGATMYVDGAAVAATGADDAAYVAMEAGTSSTYVLTRMGASAVENWWASYVGFICVEASELSAANVKLLYNVTRGFYDL